MNDVLAKLEPKEVFKYFEILSSIPRGSSNEKQVSDWFVEFAREKIFECFQDENNNILIKKPGTLGYENSQPVILHGHMDMVCKKEVGVEHDFLKEGLDLLIDGDFIKANGTTLGADNGIGISYFLAVLDSADIPHPPLEMAITVMEEMGKVGGDTFKTELLTGKRMIDLNWHLDDHILAGCGGDVSVKYSVPIEFDATSDNGEVYSLDVFGLIGGHCEFDIVLERANSIKVLGRIINNLLEEIDVKIESISGGVQNNVIPAEANAILIINKEDISKAETIVSKTYNELKSEYDITDPNLEMKFEKTQKNVTKVFSGKTSQILIKSIMILPHGVNSMSFKIKGISECSCNIGLMTIEDNQIVIIATITSGVTTRKHEMMKQFIALADLIGNGVEAKQFGCDAPEWEYNPDSQLLAISKKSYKNLFGEEAKIEIMPASLELGLFKGRIPGLDIISIGTETHGVHTPEEKLKFKSVEKVWKLFKEVLKNLN